MNVNTLGRPASDRLRACNRKPPLARRLPGTGGGDPGTGAEPPIPSDEGRPGYPERRDRHATRAAARLQWHVCTRPMGLPPRSGRVCRTRTHRRRRRGCIPLGDWGFSAVCRRRTSRPSGTGLLDRHCIVPGRCVPLPHIRPSPPGKASVSGRYVLPGHTRSMPSRQNPVHDARRFSAWVRMELGAELRIARISAGHTQRQVGRAVGRSPSRISRIESGRVPRLSLMELSMVAAAVGMKL
jgi:DNA-binding XRE family transcriptional regulator